MKKSTKSSPTKKLNVFLTLILCILAIGILVGTYFAQLNLTSSAQNTHDAISKLRTESAPIQNIDAINHQNQEYKDILQITDSLYVSSQDAQPVITQNINKYATLTGIQITNTTYPKDEKNRNGDSNFFMKIESSKATSMNSILQFIKLIENNLPKMYVKEISLEENGQAVLLNSITIGVETK